MEVIPGRWFKDEEAVKTARYPIVFIHGINASSDTWIHENDMLQVLRGAGYQSVLIDLHPDEDMWRNGKILAEKLKEISTYFNEKLVIVGHSKGGVDAQSATVHYGATPYVERVITLSTPHHGSELADLAFSKWAGWLTDGLKSKTQAVFSLQTGYMKGFRSATDELDLAKKVPFYTFGGTGWGGAHSELFWGGLYLSRFGQSDGAVLVKSSRLPYAKEVAVRDWTHTTIKEGREVFPYIKDLFIEEVKEVTYASVLDMPLEGEISVLHRGGKFEGMEVEEFSVEEGIAGITVDWISDKRDSVYELLGPDGQVYTKWRLNVDATGYFPGAYHHSVHISRPVDGKWEVRARARKTEHYMVTILFQHQGGSVGESVVSALNEHDHSMKKTYTLHHIPIRSGKKHSTFITSGDLSSLALADFEEGVHNITLDIEGKTKLGNQFQRTMIRTVYVDGKGNIY